MQDVLTPREIISRYIDRNTVKESGLVTVRGVLKLKDNADANSKKKSFDYLKDESEDSYLTLFVSENLREYMKNGETVEVSGTISDFGFRNQGVLRVQMNVTDCVQAKELFVTKVENDKYRIRRRKAAMGQKDVRKILYDKVKSGQKPRIAVIYPSTTVADTDFRRAIGEAYGYYDFENRSVPFTDSGRLVSVLDECDSQQRFDLVCIVRGGGSGLENLDDINVLSRVAEMKTPVLTAIGHAEDNLFIDTVSDLSKETPSLLGTFFKEIASEKAKIDALIERYEESISQWKKYVIGLGAGVAALLAIVIYLLTK